MALSDRKIIGYKNDIIVDAAFLSNREITLVKVPILDTERVFLNGLLIGDDCYSLSENILTIDPGLPIEENDAILVRYLS